MLNEQTAVSVNDSTLRHVPFQTIFSMSSDLWILEALEEVLPAPTPIVNIFILNLKQLYGQIRRDIVLDKNTSKV